MREIAIDLGISESGLRRWMEQADVDEGTREGLSTTSGRSWCGCAGSCG